MTIRYQRVPGTLRIERERPRDWLRRAAATEQTERRRRAQAERATPAQVRYALALEGLSARALAERLHVSRSAVADTVRGRRHTPEVCGWALGVLRDRGRLEGC